MTWVTCEAAGRGLVAVQLHHIVTLYDEQSSAQPPMTGGDVHVLRDITVRRAAAHISAAADAAALRTE